MPNYGDTFLRRDQSTTTSDSKAKSSAEFIARPAAEDDILRSPERNQDASIRNSLDAAGELAKQFRDSIGQRVGAVVAVEHNDDEDYSKSHFAMDHKRRRFLAESRDASLRGLVELFEYRRFGEVRIHKRVRLDVHQPTGQFTEQAYACAGTLATLRNDSSHQQLRKSADGYFVP